MLKIESDLPVALHNFPPNNLYVSISPFHICTSFIYFLPLLKRVKTSLRSTTRQARLNHLMLLRVYKELADGIDMVVVVANLSVGTTSGASTCSTGR